MQTVYIMALYHLVVLLLVASELAFLEKSAALEEVTGRPNSHSPTQQKWSGLARSLDEKLSGFLDKVSGIEGLQKAYEDAESRGSITFEPVDGEAIVTEVASVLGDLLRKKVESLKASVEHAEKIVETYEWNITLKEDDVEYLHAKELNDSIEPLEYNVQYKKKVYLNSSSIHIPVDIYKGNVNILNAIAWTSGLDEVWKENKEQDPSLIWQYFGSQTGVQRTYPASKWATDKKVDLYDVRRRPWYTQGASSPKEMLILIEKSGSSHGQALALMKYSVESIIDTLGEDDFVNVAEFSSDAKFSGCFHKFVQATARNKKKVISFTQSITSGQVANYTLGFEFAFRQFANYSNSTDRSSEGADCNPIIMLFSDGTSDVPEEVFRRYNPTKKIRIFSFAVGPIAGTPPQAPKEIGCSNRGYFYQIPAMGAIRSTVQGYLSILSHPLVSAQGSDRLSWTSPHFDKMEMGLVISVTMPVFNRTNNLDIANQTILGVMGVDVLVKELMDAVPQDKLGPNGYAFALNSNGIVLFHPKLEIDKDGVVSSVVDFAEIEEETPERTKIRNEMIDQISNTVEITDWIGIIDEHHADRKKRTYYYKPIPDTNFSVAVVLPDYIKHHLATTPHISLEDGTSLLLTNNSNILIDYKNYCHLIPLMSNESSDMENFVWTLTLNESECNSAAVQHLLFDAFITSSLEDIWKGNGQIKKQEQELSELESNNTDNITNSEKDKYNSDDGNRTERSASSQSDGVMAQFVITNADFKRVYPANASLFEDEDDKRNLQKLLERLTKRSLDSDVWMFATYPEEIAVNQTARMVLATKAVSLRSNNFKPAAVGVQLTPQRFHDLLFANDFGQCTASDDISCFVLDDGGFIVSSSLDDFEGSVGKFFGEEEGEVMHALVDQKVFEGHTVLDYQGVCYETNIFSAGFRILPPVIYEILSLNWWTTASAWSYLNVMSLYSWLFAQVPNVEAAKEPVARPCLKELNQYRLNLSEFSAELQCNNCSRSYASIRLQSTNLVMVRISGEKCGCKEDGVPYQFEETELDPLIEEEEDGKPCTVKIRYRKRPPCYDVNPQEPDSYCGASSLRGVSRLYSTLFFSIVFIRLVLDLVSGGNGC